MQACWARAFFDEFIHRSMLALFVAHCLPPLCTDKPVCAHVYYMFVCNGFCGMAGLCVFIAGEGFNAQVQKNNIACMQACLLPMQQSVSAACLLFLSRLVYICNINIYIYSSFAMCPKSSCMWCNFTCPMQTELHENLPAAFPPAFPQKGSERVMAKTKMSARSLEGLKREGLCMIMQLYIYSL